MGTGSQKLFSPHLLRYNQAWLLSCFLGNVCSWSSYASLTNNRSNPAIDVDNSCAKILHRSWLISSRLIECRLNRPVVICSNPFVVECLSTIYLTHARNLRMAGNYFCLVSSCSHSVEVWRHNQELFQIQFTSKSLWESFHTSTHNIPFGKETGGDNKSMQSVLIGQWNHTYSAQP